ncbi:MAG: ABC transporter ATP-binding protein/permease [Cyclobacteriaceae bacterium]|nr:ABC transporter ATP-binding protein/permease [Cyclobacteriaceae bacterium]
MSKKEKVTGKVVDWNVLKRLMQFIKPYKWQFIILIGLTLLTAALVPIRPYIIQLTLDNEVANGDFEGLIKMISLLLGLLVFQAIIQYFHTYLSGWVGQYIIKDIRVKLYKHLINLKLSFFDKTPIGRLVTRVISDIETLSDVFSQGLAAIVGDLLQLFFIIGFMLYADWRMALVSLITFPIMLFATYVFKEKIKVSFNQVRNAVANLNTFVQEHVTGMSIVQIFNSEKSELKKFESINKEHKKANINSVLYYSIYFPVAEIISATGIGLLIWYGAKAALHEEVTGISIGMLIAFIMYIQLFFRPVRQIADRFNTLQLGIVSTSRILNLLDNKEFVADDGDYAPEKFEGKVDFNSVWFAYEEENYVLKNVSLQVESGQTIAIVGATGAGKSSIINLLSRLYEINKGEILIGDIPLQEFKVAYLRKQIGVVLQDVFLFSDSILNNITLGNKDLSEAKILEAAELVGATKFIDKLPGGLHYNVLERGAGLSVGQRQLISFVRAMVYNPKILVLDEATSSIDSETEEMIQHAISRMMKGRTSIVIAHRLSTIQNADKIIVLDKGEIKEVGTHESLIEKNGFYAQLHSMQYKAVV